jgi:hypothetical protein
MIRHHRAPEPPPIFSTFHYGRDIILTAAETEEYESLQRISLAAATKAFLCPNPDFEELARLREELRAAQPRTG